MSLSKNGKIKELTTKFIKGTINIAAYVLDLKSLAEDIIDASVMGFSDIVTRHSPSDGGMIKGLWKVAKKSYDYYGLKIDPYGFAVGFIKDKLNNVADRIINDSKYKEKVGEAIYVDSITNANGEKFIFNDYGLIEEVYENGNIECDSWYDQSYVEGEEGVKGDFK